MAHVVHFTGNDLALHAFVALEQLLRVVLLNTKHEGLTERQNKATTQLLQFDFFRNLLAHFKVRLNFQRKTQRDLRVFVFNGVVIYNDAVAPDFQIAFVRIDNHIEVVVRSILLFELGTESVLDERHQGNAIDVLFFLELAEGFNNGQVFHGPECA